MHLRKIKLRLKALVKGYGKNWILLLQTHFLINLSISYFLNLLSEEYFMLLFGKHAMNKSNMTALRVSSSRLKPNSFDVFMTRSKPKHHGSWLPWSLRYKIAEGRSAKGEKALYILTGRFGAVYDCFAGVVGGLACCCQSNISWVSI